MAARSRTSESAKVLAALDESTSAAKLEIDGHSVAVTHLNRIYWPAVPMLEQPAITKRTFLRYLVTVSRSILRHLADRPLTIFRWPEGIERRRVLQKHWEIELPPFVE